MATSPTTGFKGFFEVGIWIIEVEILNIKEKYLSSTPQIEGNILFIYPLRNLKESLLSHLKFTLYVTWKKAYLVILYLPFT